MQSGNQTFINQLKDIVGGPQLLTGDRNTERYRKGFRSGEGQALAVVFPTSLLQLWRILQIAKGIRIANVYKALQVIGR